MTKFKKFVEIFQLPPAMHDYIDYVVDEQEMDLVVGLDGRSMTRGQVAELMGLTEEAVETLLEKAFLRRIINKETEDGVTTYAAATFYERLDPIAMYEQWGEVPAEVREQVCEWQMQEFIERYKPVVDEMLEDPDAYYRIPNRDVLLLEEALEMVDAATEHVLHICDCRAITRACDRPLEVCIRLDEGARYTLAHGQGRQVSKEECKAAVIDANRAGLMQTGLRAWKERSSESGIGSFGFCNCCLCDCYPFRAGMRLDIEKQWPRSHHLASRDMEKCVHCGLCAKRCYFDAFYRGDDRVEVNGKRLKAVRFDAEKCWGCGICATACPEGAIDMIPLREEETTPARSKEAVGLSQDDILGQSKDDVLGASKGGILSQSKEEEASA